MRPCATFLVLCLMTALSYAAPAGHDRLVRPAARAGSLDRGEFLIDTGLVLGREPGNQSEPAVGFDGANFLVVWADERSGVGVRGTRVTQNGAVLDLGGLVVSDSGRYHAGADIAFDGTNYLVVWADHRSNSMDVFGARLTPGGVLLDSGGFLISRAPLDQLEPAVAFDGTNYLVVWTDERNASYDIYGARVTTNGRVLDTTGIAVTRAISLQTHPDVAFCDTCFLVVWDDWRSDISFDIYAARIGRDGEVLDTGGLLVTAAERTQSRPAVAGTGSGFLAIWDDSRNGTWDIYGTPVSLAGTVLDTAGIPIAAGPYGQSAPAVAFDGTNVLVGWEDERADLTAVFGSRVTPEGVVLDTNALRLSTTPASSAALGYGAGKYLLAWERDVGLYGTDIYGARVTTEGVVMDAIALTGAASDQYYPVTAFNGTNYLVAWQERPWYDEIYAIRVSPDGRAVDPASSGMRGTIEGRAFPSVASNGSGWLVVWSDYWGVWSARMTAEGHVANPGGFCIAAGDEYGDQLSAAWDGTNYMVVWSVARGSPPWQICGARVTPNAVVLDTGGFPVFASLDNCTRPALAFDGTNYLAVWQQSQDDLGDNIIGTRITPGGEVLDPAGIVVSAAPSEQRAPQLAWDGSSYMVVWQDRRNGSEMVYAARVTPGGTVLDSSGIPVARSDADWPGPHVAFDGSNYVVAWLDQRGSGDDIYCARVGPEGVLLDSGPVVTEEGNQTNIGLAHGPSSQVLLVYEGMAGIVNGKTYNASRIWGTFGPFPGVHELPEPIHVDCRYRSTIVRNILMLGRRLTADGSRHETGLYDANGRKVLDLASGPNDVRYLAPGVYFIRAPSADSGKPSAITKVVIAR